MKELYIPINIDRISFYLSAGIIKPDIYFDKNIDDIQSKFKNTIIATANKTLIENSNCLILAVLEDGEYQDLGSDIYAINSIPISRIRYIYIENQEDIINVISNITRSTTVGGEAFVDESLFRNSPNLSASTINLPNNLPLDSIKFDEFNHDKFDRLLGAMAFIQFNNYKQYNKEFFEELGSINSQIVAEFKKTTKFNMSKKGKNRLKADLAGYENRNYRSVVEGILAEDGKTFEYRLSGDKLKAKYDILAFSENKKDYQKERLNLYSVFYNLSTCGELISDECEKMSVDCLFIYGYNRGYYDLRSYYGNKKIKFDLNLYIDRFAIEAIYNFIKNPKSAIDGVQQLSIIDEFNHHKTKDRQEKNEFYLLDAECPIDFDGFIRDLENYKNNKDLIKKIYKIYLEIKQEKRLLERTDVYIKNFEASSDKLANSNMLKDLSELLTDTLKTIRDIPQNHQNIITSNRKFYLNIANIPEIKIENEDLKNENLELKAENEKLKDEIDILKNQLS